MKEVLITLAAKPMLDYPFAVVVRENGTTISQEHLVKNVREGRIFGNGMIAAGLMAKDRTFNETWPANVTIDPRFSEDE